MPVNPAAGLFCATHLTHTLQLLSMTIRFAYLLFVMYRYPEGAMFVNWFEPGVVGLKARLIMRDGNIVTFMDGLLGNCTERILTVG